MRNFTDLLSCELNSKVDTALERIQELYRSVPDNEIYVGHSGGKDSCAVYNLTKLLIPNVTVIHNTKAITHPLTVNFLYELAQKQKIHFVPVGEMEQFLKSNGLTHQIDGTKACEHDRAERDTTVRIDGVDVSRINMGHKASGGVFDLNLLFPIYDWADEDVFDFLKVCGYPISQEYGELATYCASGA